MLCPFALTHAWFVRFLTFLSSKNLRVIYHSLFCEVKLIRENNKHNSLSMKPNIFWILSWAAIAILECPFSRDRWGRAEGGLVNSPRGISFYAGRNFTLGLYCYHFALTWQKVHSLPDSDTCSVRSGCCQKEEVYQCGDGVLEHPPQGFNDSCGLKTEMD